MIHPEYLMQGPYGTIPTNFASRGGAIVGGGKSYNKAALRGFGKSYNKAALRGFGKSYNKAALRGFGKSYNKAALRGFGTYYTAINPSLGLIGGEEPQEPGIRDVIDYGKHLREDPKYILSHMEDAKKIGKKYGPKLKIFFKKAKEWLSKLTAHKRKKRREEKADAIRRAWEMQQSQNLVPLESTEDPLDAIDSPDITERPSNVPLQPINETREVYVPRFF